MAKEILLYSEIYSWTAERFITALNESLNNDIRVRMSCDGGDVEAGWGMIAKFKEHKGKKSVMVDGKANSMALFFLAYTDDVTALDVSTFVLHRAAYPEWVEKRADLMTAERWAQLDAINKPLRAALEAKIDVAKFEKLKGVTLDEVFSNSQRIDVRMNAQEAKAIGLIKNIDVITPEKRASLDAKIYSIAANSKGFAIESTTEVHVPNPIKTMITVDTLKAEHPAVYNAIMSAGVTAGIAEERDRVGAWLPFIEADSETVIKGIKEGSKLSATDTTELTIKLVSAKALDNLQKDSAGGVETPEPPKTVKTEAQKEVDSFEAALDKNLGLIK